MTASFDALGVSEPLVRALAALGITEPFPIQSLVLPDALAGRDVCGQAKTGAGKTLAFGLPLLQRTGRAEPRQPRGLVLVPTRELARQVADVLAPLAAAVGKRLVVCYGGTAIDPQIRALRALGAEVVVATPGRIIDLLQRGSLAADAIEVVVLDEADRMADMGFLPNVEWILRQLPGDRQTMLFSATLDRDVDRLVRDELRDPVHHEVASRTITVAAMEHRFLLVHHLDKVKVAAAVASSARRTLVFTRTKRGADRLCRDLRGEGVAAAVIHGDLRQRERERALRSFADGKLAVLVATDVAARGIHVDGIDIVMHFDPPDDHKGYLHRSGRTARAGERGLAVTLVLYNQELDVLRMQRRLGICQPVVQVFSNDERLRDLWSWDPAEASVA